MIAVMRALLLATLFLTAAVPRTTDIPWAWERREDLRFLGPGQTVAYYAGMITLDGNEVIIEPRRNPLFLAPHTHRIAVVRIETHRATLSAAQRALTLDAILRLFRNAEELQIDFDATRTERAFYRELLIALRGKTSARLSITALASWCSDDRWLNDLPIDEAVPMFFRMGRGAPRDVSIREPRCRGSVGISVDEPNVRRPHARRVWIFNPKPWTEAAWKAASASRG